MALIAGSLGVLLAFSSMLLSWYIPVSYTHLDVYKRQVLFHGLTPLECFYKFVIPAQAGIQSHKTPLQRRVQNLKAC